MCTGCLWNIPVNLGTQFVNKRKHRLSWLLFLQGGTPFCLGSLLANSNGISFHFFLDKTLFSVLAIPYIFLFIDKLTWR